MRALPKLASPPAEAADHWRFEHVRGGGEGGRLSLLHHRAGGGPVQWGWLCISEAGDLVEAPDVALPLSCMRLH